MRTSPRHTHLLRCMSLCTLVLALSACGADQSVRSAEAQPQSTAEVTTAPAAPSSTAAADAPLEAATAGPRADLPGPEMPINKTFRYASLEGTLVSWQLIDPATVDTCLTVADQAVSLRLHLQNSVDASYVLVSGDLALHLGAADQVLERRTGEGLSTSKGYGEDIAVGAGKAVDEVLCAGLPDDADPQGLTLVLGDDNHAQVRLPLVGAAAAEGSSYAEAALGQSVTFKDARFTLSKVIVSSGVWGDASGGGQAKAGTRWVLLPTEVDNTANPNLFIEPNEITLDVDGQKLGQEMAFQKIYQAAPYGLQQGLTARGALLFAVPDDAAHATLHFTDSTGASTAAEVPFDLPQGE